MKKVKRLFVIALLGYGLCSCAPGLHISYSDSYQKRIGTYQKNHRSQKAMVSRSLPPSPAASVGGNPDNKDFGIRQNDYFWATRNFQR